MALISGSNNCTQMKFLFAPRQGKDCMRKKLCQATRMKDFGHNRTLCLVNTVKILNMSYLMYLSFTSDRLNYYSLCLFISHL